MDNNLNYQIPNSPKPKYETQNAIVFLAEKLNLKFNESMQDWAYEIANPKDIDKYIAVYEQLIDPDQKFVLMLILIQATEDQSTNELIFYYFKIIEVFLELDFQIHAYSIYYWCVFENENLEDSWTISKYMRDLWYKMTKKKILFVCTVNKMRSLTAEKIYQDDKRFEVKSAGTEKSATTVINQELLEWADSVIVMEKYHRNYIQNKFPEIYKKKKIVCLYIVDEYFYLQQELIIILRQKMESLYKRDLI